MCLKVLGSHAPALLAVQCNALCEMCESKVCLQDVAALDAEKVLTQPALVEKLLASFEALTAENFCKDAEDAREAYMAWEEKNCSSTLQSMKEKIKAITLKLTDLIARSLEETAKSVTPWAGGVLNGSWKSNLTDAATVENVHEAGAVLMRGEGAQTFYNVYALLVKDCTHCKRRPQSP
eukprot:6490695-Amphidinium_carterae.2